MANYGVTEIRVNGTDYAINDPNLAEEFSSETAYAVGEHTTYQGKLHVFKTFHPAGAWNAAHVERVGAGQEITDALTALNAYYDTDDNLFDPISTGWSQTNAYEVAYAKQFPVTAEPVYMAAFFKAGWPSGATGGIVLRVYNSSGTALGSFWFAASQTSPMGINILNTYSAASYFKICINTNVASVPITPRQIAGAISAYVGYRRLTAMSDAEPLYAPVASGLIGCPVIRTGNLFDATPAWWKQGDMTTSRKYSVITKATFAPQNRVLYLACAYLSGWNEGANGGLAVRVYDSSDNVIGTVWCYNQRTVQINVSATYPDASYFKLEVNTNVASIAITPDMVQSAISCYAGYDRISSWMDIVAKNVPGSMADVYQNTRLGRIEEKVTAIPDVYADYLAQRIQTIRALDAQIGNHGDSFVFITDLHDNNSYYSPALAREIMGKTAVGSVVYGGDYTNEPATKSAAITALSDHTARCKAAGSAYFLRGNHDTNPYGGTGAQLTASEYYGIAEKSVEKLTDTGAKTYYIRDNESQKIRYFFLDTGEAGELDSAQQAWIAEKAGELTAAWHIVVFMHHGIKVVTLRDRSEVEPYGALTTLRGLLANAAATVCCVICGHVHIDISDTSGAYPVIATTCDAHGVQASTYSNDNRSEGTINEQAFDVFHVDTTAKTITVTRIGGGEHNVIETGNIAQNDRTFTYA